MITMDIETLDTKSSAVVLSIALVADDRELVLHPSIQQQIDLGRTISESTLSFWFSQDRDVIDKQLRPGRRVEYVIDAISDFVGYDYVITKGPSFDAAIIESLAHSVGCASPIPYTHHLDLRTFLYIERNFLGEHPDAYDVTHDALDDARYQHLTLRRILKKLSNA